MDKFLKCYVATALRENEERYPHQFDFVNKLFTSKKTQE